MFKGMALWKKMAGIGVIAVIALTVLYGAVFWSNGMVNSNIELQTMRKGQLDKVRAMQTAQLDLLLAAMDSIIDKDAGEVDKERMDAINENAKVLEDNFSILKELADTDEEKKLANTVANDGKKLIKGIQTDLVNLIKESGAEVGKIAAAFENIDDVLDKHGTVIEEALAELQETLTAKQESLAYGHASKELASSAKVHLIQVQQWLTDISATRGAAGYDDGFAEAEKHAIALCKDLAALRKLDAVFHSPVDETAKSFVAFYDKGKWMANIYIKGGHIEGNKAMSEFDAFAEDIGKRIDAVLKTAVKAEEQADTAKEAVAIAESIKSDFLIVILAAMDSIIDRADGEISEERMTAIHDGAASMASKFTKLEGLVDAANRAKVSAAKTAVGKLEEGAKVTLNDLIKDSAAKLATIQKAFGDADDNLDACGDSVALALKSIEESVSEEAHEAEEDMSAGLKTANIASLATFIVCVTILGLILTIVTRSVVKALARITGNLGAASDQTTSASGQVASASQSLAQGSSEQAASIEETSSSLEEMSSMTKQNAGNAQQANALMSESSATVSKGQEAMGRLSTAINEIKSSSDETAKIVKTIDEIAFQTNLLALNAAVEAARAGEAGKGFAVVAEEVRNLAQRASEAARNTSELIHGSVENAERGVGVAAETSTAFEEISTSAEKVSGLVAEIAAASNEQAQGIEQVNVAVGQMDGVVQQNAANAEECAAASEELSAQAEELSGMVGELRGLIEGDAGAAVSRPAVRRQASAPRAQAPVAAPRRAPAAAVVAGGNGAEAESVIPFDDDDGLSRF
jgi:methyl-accepting chemotaxis protein